MPVTDRKALDGKYASVEAQSLADGLNELLILRAMRRRLEEWAVELDANRDKPGAAILRDTRGCHGEIGRARRAPARQTSREVT